MLGKDNLLLEYPGEKVVSLGAGRFGRVDCFRRHADKKVVAVKAYIGDGDNGTTFSREFTVLHKLLGKSHYICQTETDKGHNSKSQSIVMALYPGGSLRKHIQQHFQGGVHISIARGYLAQLVSALAALEGAGIIHRDIKTNNCLLDEHGNLKLCDFGCAVDIGTSTGNKTYTIVGTPHAMAPEMVAASFGYGYSTDYWSLGVFLYELLTGSIPPWGRTNVSVLYGGPPASANSTTSPLPTSKNRPSWPSKEDSELALRAIELSRSSGDGMHASRGTTTKASDRETEADNAARRSWCIEIVDELFVLKRRGGGAGAAYGLTERERGQYNSAVDLARCLLTVDPMQRFLRLRAACGYRDSLHNDGGQQCSDTQEPGSWSAPVQIHPVFAGLDWNAVENGTAPSPNPDFDRRLGCMELLREYDYARDVISDAQQDLFAGF